MFQEVNNSDFWHLTPLTQHGFRVTCSWSFHLYSRLIMIQSPFFFTCPFFLCQSLTDEWVWSRIQNSQGWPQLRTRELGRIHSDGHSCCKCEIEITKQLISWWRSSCKMMNSCIELLRLYYNIIKFRRLNNAVVSTLISHAEDGVSSLAGGAWVILM